MLTEPGIMSGLSNMTRSEVRSFDEEVQDALRGEKSIVSAIEPSSYNFYASASLRGERTCDYPLCKLRKLPVIERFAALYGDCLVLPIQISGQTSRQLKTSLAAVFITISELRPLIDAGIVIPVPTSVCLCRRCRTAFDQRNERISAIAASLGKRYQDNIQVRYLGKEEVDGSFGFEMKGPSHLIENGYNIRTFKSRPDWLPDSLRPGDLFPKKLVADSGIVTDFFEISRYDLASQSIYAEQYGCSYLSDNNVESEFFGTLDQDINGSFSSIDLARELSHEIPLFSEIPTSRLLALRREFPEAFLTYRSALSESLVRNEALQAGGRIRAREFFRDVLEPRLNTLKSVEVSARKMEYKNVALSFGLPAISLVAGIIATSFKTNVADVLQVAGGLGIAKGLLASVVTSKPAIRGHFKTGHRDWPKT